MKSFPFINTLVALRLFRIVVGCMLAAHGIIRLYAGTVNGFGEFLNDKGFMIGGFIAWFLTCFEIIGGLTMAAGFLARWIAVVFIIEHCFGIVLVHAPNGWFVVGYQSGGAEYSVLLIFSLLLIAASAKR